MSTCATSAAVRAAVRAVLRAAVKGLRAAATAIARSDLILLFREQTNGKEGRASEKTKVIKS